MICFSEIWLTPFDTDLYNIPNYSVEFCLRSESRYGGSAIYVLSNLPYHRRQDISFSCANVESVWLEFDKTVITANNRSTIVASIYRSPSSSYAAFVSELEGILEKLTSENKNILLFGDINIDLCDLTHGSCVSYTNCFTGHGLESLVTEPTRCPPTASHSLLDHVLSNLTTKQTAGVINVSITDHYPVFLILPSNSPQCQQKVIKYNFDNTTFIDAIANTNWSPIFSEASPIVSFETFSSVFLDAYRQSTTITNHPKWFSTPRNPWITQGLLQCIRKKQNLLKKTKLQPFNHKIKSRYRNYSNILTGLLKKAKRSYYEAEIIKHKNDTKKNLAAH